MEFGLYRELVAVARPLFEAEDWSRLKGLLREGISKGAYGVDQHGVPTLEGKNDIVILFTNDVHCGVDEKIGYAGLAAYKDSI